MKITNFRNHQTITIIEPNPLTNGEYNQKVEVAEVDVTVGFIFPKTVTKKVFKQGYHWRWLDTGEFTPNRVVELLETDVVMARVTNKVKEALNENH